MKSRYRVGPVRGTTSAFRVSECSSELYQMTGTKRFSKLMDKYGQVRPSIGPDRDTLVCRPTSLVLAARDEGSATAKTRRNFASDLVPR